MRLLCINSYNTGGAFNGVARFCESFRQLGHRVDFASLINDNTSSFDKSYIYIGNRFFSKVTTGQGICSHGLFTGQIDPVDIDEYDGIILGWVADGFQSLIKLEIKVPVIWRLSDLWPILACRHYASVQYQRYSFVEKYLVRCKSEFFNKNTVSLVAPSFQTFNVARKSHLNIKSVHNIVTPIENSFFNIEDSPKPKQPQKIRFTVGFGASNFLSDSRKGFAFFSEVMKVFEVECNIILFGDNFRGQYIGKHRVDCLGVLSREELKVALLEMDVLLVTSTIDNLPQIGLEALARGCGLVASKSSGFEGISLPKSQLINCDRSVSDFLKALKMFYQLSSDANRAAFCENASNQFSCSAVLPKIKSLISEVWALDNHCSL